MGKINVEVFSDTQVIHVMTDGEQWAKDEHLAGFYGDNDVTGI